jgi:hypothetical protein
MSMTLDTWRKVGGVAETIKQLVVSEYGGAAGESVR